MSYARDGDTITLTLTPSQFGSILLALGMASGGAMLEGARPEALAWIDLADAINAGNPDYRPYNLKRPADPSSL